MQNIVTELLTEYFIEEKHNTIILIVFSLFVSIVQANGISKINASIIDAVEHGDAPEAFMQFKYFIVISFVFLLFFYGYKMYQTKLLTKLKQWIRTRLVNLLLEINNENMMEINYTNVSTPINRVSTICAMMFTDIFSGLLPSLTFTFIIGLYLMYNNPLVGAVFTIGNLIVFALIASSWNQMLKYNLDYEEHSVKNESYLLEILNNIDKIIYRGQVNHETNTMIDKSETAVSKAMLFHEDIERHAMLLNTTVSAIVIICIFIALKDTFRIPKQNVGMFIAFMTMILLYRDKMISMIQMVPDFVEFAGRTSTVLKFFKDLNLNSIHVNRGNYKNANLPFRTITFKDVGFYYTGNQETPVFNHFNLELNTTQHKIIGVTGLSGRGKSTIMKLLLKIYEVKHGQIMIDGQDIKALQPEYIRKNITYVNQTGKLFDRKVIENIMYGCEQSDECSRQLQNIMKYPKISELFRDIDIFNKLSGSLGENLSGGQRQVINIIGGLINPSKILILDEPTNALDGELKREIIKIIKDYRKNKNAIIIITHDKEVYSIFNEVVAI